MLRGCPFSVGGCPFSDSLNISFTSESGPDAHRMNVSADNF